MDVQGLAGDVDVGAALLLDLLQHVVAGGAADDELLVGPAVGAVHGESTADALDHAGEKRRQRHVLQLLVGQRLAEEVKVVLALEGDGAAVGTDALHPALELLDNAHLVISEVDEHAVFTEEQHFAEGRYLMTGFDRDTILEPESADGVECHFGDDSFAGSGAVQFGIMHDDELAVRGTLQIEFNDIHAHRDSRLNGRDGVLGPSSPVGTVGSHEHTWTVGVKQICTNLFATGSII